MEDERPNQPTSLDQSTPSGITPGLSPEQAASNTPVVPPTPPANQVVTSPSSHRGRTALLIILLLLIAGGAAYYYVHNHNTNKQTALTDTKKDIPSLSYGLRGTDLSQEYPLDANITQNRQVDTQLFEGLVKYKQLTKIVPQLATSWTNPDTSTWIFSLQHGIKFHSGRTMTATDVKYSLDYAAAHQNDNDQSNFTYLASTIKEVDVLNPYQVKVVTNGPDPVLLNRLTYLYILDSKGSVNDFNDGTGPYVIAAGTKPTANSIDLTAFNGYHGGHVYTRNLHVRIDAGGDQLATDLQNGKFGLAGDLTSKQLTGVKNHAALPVEDLGVSVLGLNSVDPKSPFSSLQARQAAAYAMDVPTILKVGGLDGSVASQIIPQSLSGYDPSIKPTPYNPTKAKQLLASVKNAATPVTLLYATNQQTPLLTELVKELNAVGFNVSLSQKDFNTVLTEGLGGQVDMFYATVDSNTLDGADILNSALEGNQIYHNTQVDNLLTQSNSILDPGKRLAAIQKISRLVATDVPYVPLYTQTRYYLYDKAYHLQLDIPSSEAGIYFWRTYQ